MSKQKARKIVEMYNIEYPIDLEKFCKNIDIDVIESHNLKKDGYLCRELDCKIILINNQILNKQKRRFIIAHEIGHYFLHTKELIQACMGINDVFNKYEVIANSEMEANAFASELMAPVEMVKNYLSNDDIGFELIKRIAIKFDVSITSMAIKCIENSKTENEILISYMNGSFMWYTHANKSQYIKDIQQACPYGSLAWEWFNNDCEKTSSVTSDGIWKMFSGCVHEEVFRVTKDICLIILSGEHIDYPEYETED